MMSDDNLTLPYRRKLAIRHHTDILIVGGGPAGFGASINWLLS